MIAILSPAKSLDFETNVDVKKHSEPMFLDEANQLAKRLKEMSPKQLTDLMDISSRLANLNYERYQKWQNKPGSENTRQAVFAFKGDVYLGLEAAKLDSKSLNYAQDHLRILSGLYGYLRPLDMIQPHRLEMGSGLATSDAKNLYNFWKEKITTRLREELRSDDKILLNLASNEYFSAIDSEKIQAEIITPVFKDFNNGKYKIISFYAKKARGQMAAFMIKNKVRSIDELKTFEQDGYIYNEKMSQGTKIAFTRG